MAFEGMGGGLGGARRHLVLPPKPDEAEDTEAREASSTLSRGGKRSVVLRERGLRRRSRQLPTENLLGLGNSHLLS